MGVAGGILEDRVGGRWRGVGPDLEGGAEEFEKLRGIVVAGNRIVDVSEIYWDPHITPAEKIDKMIEKHMEKSNADILLSGELAKRSDGGVNLRFFALDRSTRTIATSWRVFMKEEFYCSSANRNGGLELCFGARQSIKEEVFSLLKEL